MMDSEKGDSMDETRSINIPLLEQEDTYFTCNNCMILFILSITAIFAIFMICSNIQ